jgi:hypothetical protein
MAIKHFRPGSSVFNCRVCDRKARESRNPGAGDICDQCWELAGIENTLSDNGLEQTLEWGCRDTAIAELKTLKKKGVDFIKHWGELMTKLKIDCHHLN